MFLAHDVTSAHVVFSEHNTIDSQSLLFTGTWFIFQLKGITEPLRDDEI